MLLVTGAKVLVCHRRLFLEDLPRYFVGTVTACTDSVAKVTGYSWTRDPGCGFIRKEDERTKIVAIGSGSVIVYELPLDLEIEDLRIDQPGGHTVSLIDGRSFRMDLSERQIRRADAG